MNIEQLANEVRTSVRHYRRQRHDAERRAMLAGRSREEQLEIILAHIRYRSLVSPREWYR